MIRIHPHRLRALLLAALAAALLATGVVAVAPSAGAQSDTVYVAPNGNDANRGTRSSPKATIQGAMLALRGGGEIVMRGGSYTISNSSGVVWQGGERGNPLVIRSAKGERARLRSTPGNYCVSVAADHVRVKNLECSGWAGIGSYNASHVVFRGNYVHDITADRLQGIIATGDRPIRNITVRNNRVVRVPHTGIAVGATRASAVSDVLIKKNKVRQANYQFRNTSASGGWGSGISAVGADDVLIVRTDVRRTYGEGYNCALSNRCRVRRNVGVDAYGTIFYGDNATNSLWEDNVAKTTGDRRFYRNYGFGGIEAAGYVIANEAGWFSGPGAPVSGNVFRNNIAINVNIGWRFGEYGNGSAGMTDTIVANNTFVGTSVCGIRLHSPSTNRGNRVVNNIVVPDRGKAAFCGGDRGTELRNNLWARGSVEGGLRAGDVRGMPDFVKGTGLKASSYKLKSGSRGVNDGRSISLVTDDRNGRSRPSSGRFDIGAFER